MSTETSLSKGSSQSSIMTVGEMIDTAFGDAETNTVNHKLVQTVLFLLAKQLHVLERKVAVKLPNVLPMSKSSSSISITEIKIHTNIPKKKKKLVKTTSEKGFGGTNVTLGFAIPGGGGRKGGGGYKAGGRDTDGGGGGFQRAEGTKNEIASELTKKIWQESMVDQVAETAMSKGGSKAAAKALTKDLMMSSSKDRGPSDYAMILDEVEQQREAELRVIRQRVDSREAQDKTPTPIASMDSVEATYEKLIIVQRVATDAGKGKPSQPGLSVVTQEQFDELAKKVRKLQEKFGPVGSASFPENIKLMEELRRGASLTDAMAALQLSARLEATEKTLEQMLSLVTQLAAQTPGIDLDAGRDTDVSHGKGGSKRAKSLESLAIPLKTPASVMSEEVVRVDEADPDGTDNVRDLLTHDELDEALQELSNEMMKMFQQLIAKVNANADSAKKLATSFERKIEVAMNMGSRMEHLETLVADYSLQINAFDTGLSAQITNYQEELTQMQHDLETALETMAEVLANSGGDNAAVAEMNAHFNNLQTDIENTIMRQRELHDIQDNLSVDLEVLRKEIEILREVKSDRDEVADALRDKAGIGALNGMVSIEQFSAIRGDFESRIIAAYDKFNSQESLWQRAIDELLRELNEKADYCQVVSLKDDINKHLEVLRSRLHAMLEIVGEPKAAAITKQLYRDAACLSCSTPAAMKLEEHGTIPMLPEARPPRGADEKIRKEGGDYKPCYPGQPIPHPIDPRAQFCKRWCGGAHTVVDNTLPRLPPDTIITQPLTKTSVLLGSDGKTQKSGEMQPAPAAEIPPLAPSNPPEEARSDMLPSDLQSTQGAVDVTPPLPRDED